MRNQALYQQIGWLIASRRAVLGITQAVLAKAVGLSRASIANIEAGRQAVEVALLYDIAAALSCAPGELAPKAQAAYPRCDFI